MFFGNASHNLRFRADDRLKVNTEKKSDENSRTKRVSSRRMLKDLNKSVKTDTEVCNAKSFKHAVIVRLLKNF